MDPLSMTETTPSYSYSEPPGADIILVSPSDELLLVLRDDKPSIPYPNTWALLGGYIEDGESPEQALRREICEEIGVTTSAPHFFKKYVWPECIEYIFWDRLDIDPHRTTLAEGQRLAYFKPSELSRLSFASHYDEILEDFLNSSSFRHEVGRAE